MTDDERNFWNKIINEEDGYRFFSFLGWIIGIILFITFIIIGAQHYIFATFTFLVFSLIMAIHPKIRIIAWPLSMFIVGFALFIDPMSVYTFFVGGSKSLGFLYLPLMLYAMTTLGRSFEYDNSLPIIGTLLGLSYLSKK